MSVRPCFRASIPYLRLGARTRTFGLPASDRREATRHGYLLALEEVERHSGGDVETPSTADVASPRDAA